MKKTLILLLTVLFFVPVCAVEPPYVSVSLNGESVDCASYGQEAVIIEGRTMVPLRAIFEALGASVEWDDETKTVVSTLDQKIVKLMIGSKTLYKGEEKVELDVSPQIVNGRTLVPVRAVAESFGVSVEWDEETRTVSLSSEMNEQEPDENAVPDKENDKNDEVEIAQPLPETHIYGAFYFGMTLEEAKSAAKGVTKEGTSAEYDILTVSDLEDEYQDEDWLVTGTYACDEIKLCFRNDILCEIRIILESSNDAVEALTAFEKIVEYFDLKKELSRINVAQPWIKPTWMLGMYKTYEADLFQDGNLIDFPEKADEFNVVKCYLTDKSKIHSKESGYYVSFEVKNAWYYEYADASVTENEVYADLLDVYTFGASKEKNMGSVSGQINQLGNNRVDISNVADEKKFLSMIDKTYMYRPEKDIYGPNFYCDFISLEYDEKGLEKIHARNQCSVYKGDAEGSLTYILEHYGKEQAKYDEKRNVYEWTDYVHKTSDGEEVHVNIFSGIISTDDNEHYCFVSMQPKRNGGYCDLDKEGRIIGTDLVKAYGKFYFGMTMEQAETVISGDLKIETSLDRICVFDKEGLYDDEDADITGGVNAEYIEIIFDNIKKTLCCVRLSSGILTKEEADEAVSVAKNYYGEVESVTENNGLYRLLWTLRGQGAIVNLDITNENKEYRCVYSVTLAGSSIAYS